MNDKLSIGITAAVFVAAFAGAFAVVGLGPNMPGLIASASPHASHLSPEPRTIGPMTTTVPSVFQRVNPADIKPGEAQRAERENEIASAKAAVKMYGLHIADSVIEDAYDDSPHGVLYSAFAKRDQALASADEREGDAPRGWKVGCYAIRKPDDRGTLHLIVRYSDTQMGTDDAAQLWKWVITGCAQAVRTGTTLSPAQLNVTMLDMMPKTADYEQRRRQWQAHLTPPAKSGNRFGNE